MPSKSRGLRTSTGCTTCRKRRVKCDEGRPKCKNCIRVDRSCTYAFTPPARRTLRALSSVADVRVSPEGPAPALPTQSNSSGASQVEVLQPWNIFSIPQTPRPDLSPGPVATGIAGDANSFLLDDSIISFGDIVPLNYNSLGPLEWYDLLAQDAITNIEEHNASSSSEQRWNFDIFTLSRRQTPRQSRRSTPAPEADPPLADSGDIGHGRQTDSTINVDFFPTAHDQSQVSASSEPWNTSVRIELSSEDIGYFEHYISVVGPILDLFDPAKHFSSVVPHLALRNVGLLKSLLAVGACHMALHGPSEEQDVDRDAQTQNVPPTTPSSASALSQGHTVSKSISNRVAEQYYYETLHYLSQNLLYPSYTCSHEILATAIMISTYEMFGAYSSSSSDSGNGNWGRHLKGAFWIQRNQDNDGESSDGLRRAVWWAWLRQDIWAAFREGRPAMTIWAPKKPLESLSSDELATRIIYITAKCVQFVASAREPDFKGYIEKGDILLRMLSNWRHVLPSSFEPIPVVNLDLVSSLGPANNETKPIWIHPPSHAAAIQTYHFARIIVLLNQPTTGGLNKYQTRGKMLRESMATICGIAIAQQSQNLPSAFVSFQTVYAAALCAETRDKQIEITEILRASLSVSRFPATSMLVDLVKLWEGDMA